MKYIRQRHRGTEVQRYRGIRAGAFKMIRSLLYLDCLGFVCFSCSHSWFPQKEIWASDWGKLGSWCEGRIVTFLEGGSFLLHVRFRENEALCKKRLSVLLGKHEGKFGIQKGGRGQLLHAIPVAFRECDNFLLHVPVSRSREDFCFSFPLFRKVEVSWFRLHNYSEVNTMTFRFIQRKSDPIF